MKQEDLKIGAFLGAGAYGSVYFGHWSSRKVAIKKFNVGRNDVAQLSAIQKEVDLLERLRFRHIIQFYGKTFYDDNLVLVMDYADGGSLEDAIIGQKLDWPTKTRVWQEIASGLAYIHHEGILHRDLKSANVLLTKYVEVKLADFGLAMVKSTSSSKSSGDALKGTIRWMAPELFAKKPQYSTKSDIYALGMVMWEMAANCTRPFKDQPDNFTVMALVKSGEREDLPDDTPQDYRVLVDQCWDANPSSRPEAAEMVAEDEDPMAPNMRDRGAGSTLVLSEDVLGFSISSTTSASTRVASDAVNPQLDDFSQLRRRAEDGELEAQVALAAKYEKGDGVDANPSDAFLWHLKAAESGHVGAQWKTGEHFYSGRGAKQNYDDALKWFRKAAEEGHAEAQFRVGWMLSDEDELDLNYPEAVKWFRRAAEQEHPGAQCQLGLMYQHGRGVPRNYVEAMMWFLKSSNYEYPLAYHSIGYMFQHGLGVVPNYDEAKQWYEKALEHDHLYAQYNLGEMYEKGQGVTKDIEKAKEWYNKAANQGDFNAMNRLEELEKPQGSQSFFRKIFG